MKARTLFVVFILLFLIFNFSIANSMVNWTDEKIRNLTVYLQQYKPEWTENQTAEMIHVAEHTADYINMLTTSNGAVFIQIFGGETVLVNGKDVTGNLGNKITYGNNSPIIGDVTNSNITIASNNKVNINQQSLDSALSNLKQNVSNDTNISSIKKTTDIADIDTIQAQLRKEKPNRNIIKEAWEEIKNTLQGYDYVKQILEISALIIKLFRI